MNIGGIEKDMDKKCKMYVYAEENEKLSIPRKGIGNIREKIRHLRIQILTL
jgi:hypothetical protein